MHMGCTWSWHGHFSMSPLLRSAVAMWVHRKMSLISGWPRSLSASCDNRYLKMHSDKKLIWLGSVWRLSDSRVLMRSMNRKMEKSLGILFVIFFWQLCCELVGFRDMNKKKKQIVSRSLKGIAGWLELPCSPREDCEECILSKNDQSLINLCLWFSV